MKTNSLKRAFALGLTLGWLLVWGCGESRLPFAGTYRSLAPFADSGYIDLHLKENGEATWSLAQEGKSFKLKWRVADGRLWFYTKEGGLMIATPGEGGQYLAVDLTGDWHPGCPPQQCINFKKVQTGG